MRARWPALPLIAALALAALAGVPGPGPAHAQTDPDFSNVGDILQGRRVLLPVDDLVIAAGPCCPGPGITDLVLQTTGSQITSQSSFPITGDPQDGTSIAVGRLLRQGRDVVVTMTPGLLNVTDVGHQGWGFGVSGFPRGMLMADLNGDGLDEVALLTSANHPTDPPDWGLLRILTASNPEDMGAGVIVSDGIGPNLINFTLPTSIAVADLNGNGKREIVLAQVLGAARDQLVLNIYEVLTTQDGKIAPQALRQTASVTTSPNLFGGDVIWSLQVLAGDFDGVVDPTTGVPVAEIVLVVNNGNSLTLQTYRVSADLGGVTLASQFVSADTVYTSTCTQGDPLFAAAGRLDWFNPAEQVVVAYTAAIGDRSDCTTEQSEWWYPVAVFTLNSQLQISQASSITTGVSSTPLALGNFNFDPDLDLTAAPNLQIARLFPSGGPFGNAAYIEILSVNPANSFALSVASQTPVQEMPFGTALGGGMPQLVAGDTQGRSLRLGPPNKVTITNYQQPEIILGAPPMHVAWATPMNASTPVELNVTGVPNSFFSRYQTQVTQQDQSSRKSTTSFSYSTKETTETTVSFGVPLVASVSATIKTAAEQTHDSVVSSTYNHYASRSFDASTQTGFDDHVWFTGSRVNIYYYPVIGHCIACQDASACAEAADSCPAGTRPLVVQFSGPDQVVHEDIDGANLEWYQPVHQVGNVLSYPQTQSQLEALIPRFNLLSEAPPETFFTGSAATTEQVNWAQGGGSQVTHGSSQTNSLDVSVSVSDSATAIGDFFTVGASGSATFSTNLSASVATLNSTEESMGESTGVGMTTASTFLDPADYQYGVTPLISGQIDPPGTLQTVHPATDQQSTGILRAIFTAGPTDSGLGAGPWWDSTYTLPDLALNHPARWVLSTQTSSPNENPPSHCLRVTPGSTAMDCLTFRTADPTDVAGSGFYWMKGFFITPDDAAGAGPQLVQATAGDVLQLQVRVYNLSLADMPQGSVVRVQFYGQLFDNSTHRLQPGTSFFIGEEAYGPIPGFDSTGTDGAQPNWILAGTTFDTTGYHDQYLVFWVVVWGEAGTSLMAEMPGHGLTAIPGAHLGAITDVPIESHSNNVGFYRQPIYIKPPPAAAVLVSSAPAPVIVPSVTVSPAQVPPHRTVTVQATLAAVGGSADGVSVFFYDGDPRAGGRAFDHEMVPHIRPDDTYLAQVLFEPRTCGDHTLVVVANPGRMDAGVGSATLRVALDPVEAVADLARFVAGFGLPHGIENSLLAKVRAAEASFARGNTTPALNQLGALQHQLNAQRGKQIPVAAADAILENLQRVRGCLRV